MTKETYRKESKKRNRSESKKVILILVCDVNMWIDSCSCSSVL